MTNRKRHHFMTFGPPIPIVPVGDFSRMKLSEEQWADAWHICGPSAEQNMRRGYGRRGLELWQVIASAYLEGLQHGAALAREQHDNGNAGQALSGMVATDTGPDAAGNQHEASFGGNHF